MDVMNMFDTFVRFMTSSLYECLTMNYKCNISIEFNIELGTIHYTLYISVTEVHL